MLFNSLEYVFFFIVIVSIYYAIQHKWRWLILLVGSYFFYMCWKPQYAILILFSTVLDYWCGLKMSEQIDKKHRKFFLTLSLISNLGLLLTFKYLDFFIGNINTLIPENEIPLAELILPMGISFYTFQTMSYSIDIYKGEIKAERHFGKFGLYVTFFPQLVAGPIERAKRLLPQFHLEKRFSLGRAVSGGKLIIWGLFKKILIADQVSVVVDAVFESSDTFSSPMLVVASVLFAIQIYCDFSGYSDIAIGSARVLGFDLMTNFKTPYFALSFKEFWQRWHISLSQWFQDYVYIPLGGNRVVKWRWYYNLYITFLVSGFWHGANWTFIIWGGLHGLYLILENVVTFKLELKNWFLKFLKVSFIFSMVCFAWIFFRAESASEGAYFIQRIFNFSLPNSWTDEILTAKFTLLNLILFSLVLPMFFFKDLSAYRGQSLKIWNLSPVFYASLVILILVFGSTSNSEFIYFQF